MSDQKSEFDKALFERAQAGDLAAQQELLLEFFDPLHRRIAGRLDGKLATQVTSEDLIQDTFVEAVRDLAKCKATSRGEFIAWLVAISDNRVRDARRFLGRAKRGGDRKQVALPQGDRSSVMHILDMLGEDDGTPSVKVSGIEAEAAIHVGVATLPPDQREAIERRFLSGESLDEVAEQMKKSPAAVRGLLHRAKAALRGTLGRSSKWFLKK